MAENKQLDKLNRLQEEGRINPGEHEKEERIDLEEVAKGKKSVDEVPQVVTMEMLKENAMKNKVFLRLENCCSTEGIQIYAYLMRCFDNETIKPSQILEEIGLRIPRLIRTINEDEKNNLVFNDNGILDPDKSIEKALKNGLPIARHVEDMVKVETKKEKEDRPLPEERVKELVDFKKEFISNWKKEISKPEMQKFKDDFDAIKNNKKFNGNSMSKEDYELFDFLNQNAEYVDKMDVRTVEKEIEAGKELYARLVYLKGCRDKIKNPGLKAMLEKQIDWVSGYVVKLLKIQVKDLDNENVAKKCKLSEEELENYLKDKSVEYDKVREESGKEYDSAKNYDIQEAIEKSDQIFFENYDELKLVQTIMLVKAIRKKHIDIKEDEDQEVFLKNIKKNKPDLYKKSKESFRDDDSVDSFVDVLESKIYKTLLEEEETRLQQKVIEPKEKTPENIENVNKGREFGLVMKAIHLAMKEYDSKNVEENDLHNQALAIVRKYLPDAFDVNGRLQEKYVCKAIRKNYSHLKIYRNIQERENSAKSDEEKDRIIMQDAEARVLSGVEVEIKKALIGGKAERKTGFSILDIIKSDDFVNRVNGKTEFNRSNAIDKKAKIELEKRFDYNKKLVTAKKEQPDIYEYDMVKFATIIYSWKDYTNNQFYNDALIREAQDVIIEYFPNCVVNGEIDIKKLNDEYAEFKKKMPQSYRTSVAIDAKEEVLSFKNGMAQEYYQETQRKKYQDKDDRKKIREKNKETRSKVKTKEDENVLNFINVLEKGRSLNELGVVDETTTAINLLKDKVKNRLKNKIRDRDGNEDKEAFDEVVRRNEETEVDRDVFKNMARAAKLTLIKRDSKDLLSEVKKSADPLKTESARIALDYYIGTKRDLDENPIYNNDDAINVKRLKIIVKGLFPEAFVKGEVNESILLEKYNELYGTDFKNPDEMFEVIGDKVLGKYVSKVVEGLDENKGYNTEYSNVLANGNLQRRTVNDAEKFEKIYFSIDYAIDIMNEFHKDIQLRQNGKMTKEEEIAHIKNCMALLTVVHGRVEDTVHKDDIFAKYHSIVQDVSKLVSEEIKVFFPEAYKENGDIDVSLLEDAYTKFVAENHIEFESNDLVSGLNIYKAALERKREIESEKGYKGYRTLDTLQIDSRLDEVRDKISTIKERVKESGNIEGVAITDEEAKTTIEKMQVEMVVDSPASKATEPRKITDEEVKDVIAEKSVVIGNGENNVLKSNQQSMDTTSLHIENIETGEEKDDDNLLIPVKENVFTRFMKGLKGIAENVKTKIIEIKDSMFSGNNSDTTGNNDSGSNNSSTGGVTKVDQDRVSVKNLTGYDKINLTQVGVSKKTEEPDRQAEETKDGKSEQDDEKGM